MTTKSNAVLCDDYGSKHAPNNVYICLHKQLVFVSYELVCHMCHISVLDLMVYYCYSWRGMVNKYSGVIITDKEMRENILWEASYTPVFSKRPKMMKNAFLSKKSRIAPNVCNIGFVAVFYLIWV